MAPAPTGVAMRHNAVVCFCNERGHPIQVTTIGLDLAKNIYQAHGITNEGEVAFNRPLRRAQVLTFFKRLEPCLVGMESCGTSHHWARELGQLDHEVRLIPPMYVKPYGKRGKSDAIDAEATCEAGTRPTMRLVEIKCVDQQALVSLHRVRNLIVRKRTQRINALRSSLAEVGVCGARGLERVNDFAKSVVDGVELDLPVVARDVFRNLCQQLGALHEPVRWYEARLRQEAKCDARVRLLQTILGVGAVTASALAASIGDGHQFKNGRELVAWFGLTRPTNRAAGRND